MNKIFLFKFDPLFLKCYLLGKKAKKQTFKQGGKTKNGIRNIGNKMDNLPFYEILYFFCAFNSMIINQFIKYYIYVNINR